MPYDNATQEHVLPDGERVSDAELKNVDRTLADIRKNEPEFVMKVGAPIKQHVLVVRDHVSSKLACGRRFELAMPGDGSGALVRHLCRAHVVETGECLCPCGARSKAPGA